MEGATATRLEGDAQQQRFVVPENQIRHFVRPLLARPCVVIQTVDLTNVEGSWLEFCLSSSPHPSHFGEAVLFPINVELPQVVLL